MLPVTFVGSLYKTHDVLCSKIADVHGIEVHDVRTSRFVFFGKCPIFVTHRDYLPKMAKFVCKNTRQSAAKVSITNYLKQNAFDYQRHLAIENQLKVERKVFRKTSKTLFPEKHAWARA